MQHQKVIRAAHTYKEDNFVDAINYLRKAQQLQQAENGEDNTISKK